MAGISKKVTDLFNQLESTGWFSDRALIVQNRLKRIAEHRVFHDKQAVFVAGDPSNGIYGIVEGTVRIDIPLRNGSQYQAYRAGSGIWIGDVATLSGKCNLTSARSEGVTQTLFLPKALLLRELGLAPRMYRDFYEITLANFTKIISVLANFNLDTVDMQIAGRLLLECFELANSEGWIDINQYDLSKMLAISLPTLQRGLRRLEGQGLLEIGYKRIRVINHQKLEKLTSA
jgi:CRP/FNR family cyclic AMP-dependent transcriptional regulator